MRIPKYALWLASGLFLAAPTVNAGQPSNYLGQVGVSDDTTPGNRLKVNPDGSINTSAASAASPTPTIPPKLTAYGTLAVSTSSVALSTLTVGPNSAAWSTTLPNNYVTVRNSVNSTAVAYFCPLGGTCTSSVGEPIAIGEAIVRQLASPATPTLICGTAAACTVIGEE